MIWQTGEEGAEKEQRSSYRAQRVQGELVEDES